MTRRCLSKTRTTEGTATQHMLGGMLGGNEKLLPALRGYVTARSPVDHLAARRAVLVIVAAQRVLVGAIAPGPLCAARVAVLKDVEGIFGLQAQEVAVTLLRQAARRKNEAKLFVGVVPERIFTGATRLCILVAPEAFCAEVSFGRERRAKRRSSYGQESNATELGPACDATKGLHGSKSDWRSVLDPLLEGGPGCEIRLHLRTAGEGILCRGGGESRHAGEREKHDGALSDTSSVTLPQSRPYSL